MGVVWGTACNEPHYVLRNELCQSIRVHVPRPPIFSWILLEIRQERIFCACPSRCDRGRELEVEPGLGTWRRDDLAKFLGNENETYAVYGSAIRSEIQCGIWPCAWFGPSPSSISIPRAVAAHSFGFCGISSRSLPDRQPSSLRRSNLQPTFDGTLPQAVSVLPWRDCRPNLVE